MKVARYKLLLGVLGFLIFSSAVEGQNSGHSHHLWVRAYDPLHDPYSIFAQARMSILLAGGVVQEKADGVYGYVPKRPLLVQKAVSYLATIDASGHIVRLEVVKSSGGEAIDQTALNLIQKAAPFSPSPKYQGAKYDGPLVVEFTPSDVQLHPTTSHGKLDASPVR
jgi:TonB family protein